MLNENLNKIQFNTTQNLLKYIKTWNGIYTPQCSLKILKQIKLWTNGENELSSSNNFTQTLIRFSSLYLYLNFNSLFNVFVYLRTLRTWDTTKNIYKLYFTFTRTRIFVNLTNNSHKNYLSLSVGLFLRFFKNKKSFKKNKLIKLLLVKYLRKLLLVSNIKNVYLYVQKTPLFLTELVKTLTTPLVNPFFNPISSSLLFENNSPSSNSFSIRYVYFRQLKPFNLMRMPRKGRLKRKIMRRIIRTNRISD